MRTALLVYSGITVKMMVDSDLGALLTTMFMVQYDPDGAAGPHDHPFEETYLFLEGRPRRPSTARSTSSGPATSRGPGVGCVHGFRNGDGARALAGDPGAAAAAAGTPTGSPGTGTTCDSSSTKEERDDGLVVIGGTAGIGREVARRSRGARRRGGAHRPRRRPGRRRSRRPSAASARGIALDLADPHGIAAALADVGSVDHLVLAAIERDENTAADYDIDRATQARHAQAGRLHRGRARAAAADAADGSIVLFGGLAKDRPYPGSTTVSTVNGGVVGMVHTLAVELAPIRVNAIHPGIVGDSPFWAGKPLLDGYVSRTPTGRLATMARHRRRGRVPAGQPRRQRRQPGRRRRVAAHVTAADGCGSRSSAPAGWAPRWSAGCARPATGDRLQPHRATGPRRVAARARGVTVAGTAREAAAAADVVLVSLADDAAVRGGLRAATDGIVAGLRPGAVVADTSTVDPHTVRALGGRWSRAAAATLLDAPVSGSVPSVERGELTVMAGGDAGRRWTGPGRCSSTSRSRIFHARPARRRRHDEARRQRVVHALNQAAVRGAGARREGRRRPRARPTRCSPRARSAAPFVHYKRAAFEHPDDTPVAFTLDLVAKDLDLAAALAGGVGASVPQLEANRRVVGDAIDAGLGDADLSALAVHLRGV